MGKIKKTRSERGGAKRRRTVLFQDGLGVLSVAAFLFLGATVREVNLLMALGSFFAGFAVLDYWQGKRSLRRLRVARKTPDAIFAGEPFDVEIEIDATGRRSSAWGIVVEDEWTRQEGKREVAALPKQEKLDKAAKISGKKRRGSKETKERKGENGGNTRIGEVAQEEARPNVAATTRPTAYFPRVKGGERRRERYCGVVARRGVRRLATLTASTRFPFGFFRSSERFDAPAEILVFPKIGALTERWNAAVGVARRETTVATARTSRIAGETLTVRDWRPDDSKRAIHWRATAKRDKLQARDFEKRENSVKILILDLFFDEKRGSERGFDLLRDRNGEETTIEQNRAEGGKTEKTQTGKEGQKAEAANELDAQESARRSALVEKTVSLAATLIDRWTRSNDAKFLLAINGDDPAPSNRSAAQVNLGEMGGMGAWGSRADSGSGACRRALARLATVEAPRRDRLAEVASSLDPRILSNAQIFILSVAPLAPTRLAENKENGKMGEIKGMEKTGKTFASAAERGIGGRWRGATLIDASAADFNDYFEF